MDEYEMLSPAEKKEFQKWMKFHAVYKSMKEQIEGEDEEEEGEEKPMTGAAMLTAKQKLMG